ncbi:sensor histidine kinase [Bifidobacterium catulorum]|uniref:histidine kinase n=1 Tax=Bifidobacterium catulorum TaxID=1630173 RepID=A0A2U2MSD3_9BIFI|nr:sensor histidine kinase [Bifidobacterium catulorum]
MGVHAFTDIPGGTESSSGRFVDRHLAFDIALSLTLTLLLGATSTSGTLSQNGLLFPTSQRSLMFWTCIYALPLMLRRKTPRASALAFVALCIIQLAVGPALVATDCFALMHLYAVIVHGDRAAARPFIAMAAGMTFVAAAVNMAVLAFGPLTVNGADRYQSSPYECLTPSGSVDLDSCAPSMRLDAAMVLAMMLAPVIAVIVMAYWQRARLTTIRWMQERNTALEARRKEESRIAALAERARIARDMHDVVAHTLSIIIVQADGGRFAAADDHDLARSTMETIRDESTKALDDMRHLLGIFSSDADGSDGDSGMFGASSRSRPGTDDGRPDYDGIAALVRQARATCPDIRLDRVVNGTSAPDRLGAHAQVIAYRVVQESLTNIRKYAGPHVHASLTEDWSDNGLRLRVEDDGRGVSTMQDGHKTGYGLIGMRERLESLGGTCSTGPRIGGGFEVEAFIPFSPSAVEDGPEGRRVSSAMAAEEVEHGGRAADAAPSSGETAPMYSPDGFAQSAAERIHTIFDFLRDDRGHDDAHDNPEAGDFNMIERVSRWTERHYLLVDLLAVVLLFMMFLPSVGGETGHHRILANIMLLLPLVWRRRFPQASAATFAAVAMLELTAAPWSTLAPLLSVYSVYSVTLYGPRNARRWTIPTIVLGSFVFAANFTARNYLGITTASLIALLVGSPESVASDPARGAAALPLLSACAFVSCITLLGVMAAGMWSRSRGSNMLVLRAREEALRKEEARQKVLAANMERDRISANIQADVSDTLLGVIGRADEGLRVLNDGNADPETVAAAFGDIASEGRAALKRMRQLLGVLRETGFSDDTDAGAGTMRLSPAGPLSQQLQWNTVSVRKAVDAKDGTK